jgi:hypothetical protein
MDFCFRLRQLFKHRQAAGLNGWGKLGSRDQSLNLCPMPSKGSPTLGSQYLHHSLQSRLPTPLHPAHLQAIFPLDAQRLELTVEVLQRHPAIQQGS